MEERLHRLETQVRTDKVMVAFVAEFSRGKSELINAIFFAGYGRRIMPASAGRTTMCPTEMGYDADVPPCLRLLPIETRLQPQALMEWRMAPEKWTRIDLDVNDPQQLARPSKRWPKSAHVTQDEARALGFWHDDAPRRQPPGRCPRPGRGAQMAPCADQHCPPPAQAGAGDSGHAWPERHWRRAGADGEPDSAGACGGVHSGGRYGRDQVRPVHLARAPDHRGDDTDTRLVVLNKIDTLWDALSTPEQVQAQIDKQIATSADILGLPR